MSPAVQKRVAVGQLGDCEKGKYSESLTSEEQNLEKKAKRGSPSGHGERVSRDWSSDRGIECLPQGQYVNADERKERENSGTGYDGIVACSPAEGKRKERERLGTHSEKEALRKGMRGRWTQARKAIRGEMVKSTSNAKRASQRPWQLHCAKACRGNQGLFIDRKRHLSKSMESEELGMPTQEPAQGHV